MYLYFCRNIKTQQAHIQSTVVQPLMLPSRPSLLSATIRPNGSPVLLLSDGVAYTYDPAFSAWMKVSEARWGEGSEAWEGKQRSASNRPKTVMSSIESAIADLDLRNMPASVPQSGEKPPWWNVALTLGHLETRMQAAKILDSPAEYKTNLLHYAKRIADEGFRAKAEELLKELAGPLYWRVQVPELEIDKFLNLKLFRKPNREDSWSPTVCGMQKRELLKDVMRIFGESFTPI